MLLSGSEKMSQTVQAVIHGMTELIMLANHAYECESNLPRTNPDEMDAHLAFNRNRVAKLRELRQQFEDEMSRIAYDPN